MDAVVHNPARHSPLVDHPASYRGLLQRAFKLHTSAWVSLRSDACGCRSQAHCRCQLGIMHALLRMSREHMVPGCLSQALTITMVVSLAPAHQAGDVEWRWCGMTHFWRVLSVTAWAMMLTMLGWEMPSMMDASRGSPSLMMIAARSSMTCTGAHVFPAWTQ